MSFRSRMVVAAAVVGLLAVLAASLGAYFASSNALVASVDDVLQSAAGANGVQSFRPVGFDPTTASVTTDPAPAGVTLQFYAAAIAPTDPLIPISSAVRSVAQGKSGAFYADVRAQGVEQREYVIPLTLDIRPFGLIGGALQVITPLTGVNEQLGSLGLALLIVAIAALGLAVVLGWLISRAAVGPLNGLTAAIEGLARTMDVSKRLEGGGGDELGRLRRAFNHLLGALETSQESQRRLVADAGHELRTPLTSLRTNLEIVRRIGELAPKEREVLVADVLTQMQELTKLVGDLVELARGDRPDEVRTALRLDHLVEDAADAATSHGRSRRVTFSTQTEETWVRASSDRTTRAIANLLDNAIKWSPQGGSVEVACRHGVVSVRDHGPGIAEDDLPHVFERFYRAKTARALPGSGLGLAIVAQVARDEGGSVEAENAPDGGAVLTFALPVVQGAREVGANTGD
ncbi:MAG: sensor histidine kinase [Acidimicrobiales bacterium]